MFTYHWDKKVFYILMDETVVDYLTKIDATYLMKYDCLYTDQFEIEIDDDVAYFFSMQENSNFVFVDKDGAFISCVKRFLIGDVE